MLKYKIISEKELLRRKKISDSLLKLKIKRSKETCLKMSKNNARIWLGKSGKETPAWRGDSVGYRGLHYWIEKKLGVPNYCSRCGKKNVPAKDGRRTIHWANVDGKYTRDLNVWIALCNSCHRKSHMTEELRIKLSKAHMGYKVSEATKLKMRLSQLGHHRSGWKLSEETRAKMRLRFARKRDGGDLYVTN